MATRELFITKHLSSGFLVALFALFAGISWQWTQFRGVVDLETIEQKPAALEQFNAENTPLVDLDLEKSSEQGAEFKIVLKATPQNGAAVTGMDVTVNYSTDDLQFTALNQVYKPNTAQTQNWLPGANDPSNFTDGSIELTFFQNPEEAGFTDEQAMIELHFIRTSKNTTEISISDAFVLVEDEEESALGATSSLILQAESTCAYDENDNPICQSYDLPADFCPNGTVVDGPDDECGCSGEPVCVENISTTIQTKLAGVNKAGVSIAAKVMIGDTTSKTRVFDDTVNFTSDENGVFTSTEIALALEDSVIDIAIKGPMHKIMIKRNILVSPDPTDSSLVLDLTNSPLLPGDLPLDNGVQDGVVDERDYLAIKNILDTKTTSTDSADVAIADINYSGKVTNADLSLFLGTWNSMIDEEF
ncbi:hypothetical protein GYA49_01725 [Candidatus Beckwithbacteria bacterium]|nr:hypothetical protein [Candidatus Beckwithbacteria bacterium]